MDEYGFSPERVTLENLDELSRQMSLVSEARGYEIADIAMAAADFTRLMLADGMDVADALSVISEELSFGDYPEAEGIPDGAGGGAVLLPVLDRAALVRSYASFMADGGKPLTEADFLGGGEVGERYAYVRNQFSDEAYDVFAAACTDPRVKYYPSFKECITALSEGDADRILFPLEERGGVRLPTVAELILRYDLKINSITPVFGIGADADLKYAELSRYFTASPRGEDDDGYLELRAPIGAGVSELLAVAELYGMSVYRLSTHTVSGEDDTQSYVSVVLREGEEGIVGLLLYLSLFGGDTVPVGVYKNLE